MNNYEVVGFRNFVSKKSGLSMVQIYCTFKPTERSGIIGTGTDTFFLASENLSGELYIGCSIDVRYNRSGYVSSVVVI